jgi:hypothetical protein
MSNSIMNVLEKEGYELLSENKEIAFTLCTNCYENNFFGVNDKSFQCVKCGVNQSA